MTALMEFKLKADEFNALSTCWKEKADFIHKVGYDKDFLVTNLKKLLDDVTPNPDVRTLQRRCSMLLNYTALRSHEAIEDICNPVSTSGKSRRASVHQCRHRRLWNRT
jgi:hypothetical protein